MHYKFIQTTPLEKDCWLPDPMKVKAFTKLLWHLYNASRDPVGEQFLLASIYYEKEQNNDQETSLMKLSQILLLHLFPSRRACAEGTIGSYSREERFINSMEITLQLATPLCLIFCEPVPISLERIALLKIICNASIQVLS